MHLQQIQQTLNRFLDKYETLRLISNTLSTWRRRGCRHRILRKVSVISRIIIDCGLRFT